MSKKNRRALVGSEAVRPGRQQHDPQLDRQRLIYNFYVRKLTEISCNRFNWVGMPDTIDLRFLELTLCRTGLVVFYFNTKYERYLALRGSGAGQQNMYDNPTRFIVTGNAMINETLDANKCVPIWSNYLRQSDMDIITIYAQKFAIIDRTIEINTDNMRHTDVFVVPETERLSWENLIRQRAEGRPTIVGQRGLNLEETVQHFPTTVEKDQVINLQLVKAKLWNECMTMLGINNANQDKKERLVSAEVDANDGQVMAARGIALNARLEAVERINAMYNLNVSVSFSDMPEGADPEIPTLKVL